MKLGLAQKSMNNGKKVLTILNKFGLTVSYNVAKQLEPEMTATACEVNKFIPASIQVDSNLSTHVALDNYDKFVDALSGKYTLHDAVGIIYRCLPDNYDNKISG